MSETRTAAIPSLKDEPVRHAPAKQADPKPKDTGEHADPKKSAAKHEPKPKRAPKRAAKKSAERKSAEAEDAHKGNTARTEPKREPQPRDKALEEVREIREENERRARTHDRTEIHREIVGFDASGKEKTMDFHAGGGVAYLNTHGEIRLDQDGLIELGQVRDAAFQAVS